MFHTIHSKRNFILVKADAPRSIKLYESSEIHNLRSDISKAKLTAGHSNWKDIQSKLLGES